MKNLTIILEKKVCTKKSGGYITNYFYHILKELSVIQICDYYVSLSPLL